MWEAFLYLWRFHSTQISSYRTFFLPRSMLASFKSMSHCTLNWITIRVFSSRTSTTSTPILSSRRILCKWSSLETWSMMFRSSLATISTRVWWMRSNFRKTNHFWRNCTIGGMMNWARFTLLLGSIFISLRVKKNWVFKGSLFTLGSHSWLLVDLRYLILRELDEVDPEIIEMTKEISEVAFPDSGAPTNDNILTGFKDIITDSAFNAVGSMTARKIAEKVAIIFWQFLKRQDTKIK